MSRVRSTSTVATSAAPACSDPRQSVADGLASRPHGRGSGVALDLRWGRCVNGRRRAHGTPCADV